MCLVLMLGSLLRVVVQGNQKKSPTHVFVVFIVGEGESPTKRQKPVFSNPPENRRNPKPAWLEHLQLVPIAHQGLQSIPPAEIPSAHPKHTALLPRDGTE